MKKQFSLAIFLLLICGYTYGQGYNVISHVYNPDKSHYFVGSLMESSNNVYQKLKLEVFGGTFTIAALPTDVYSINTRSANVINIERAGGGDSDAYELKVFKDGSKYDFVIQINRSYVSLFVQSWLVNGSLNSITAATPVDVVRYDPTGKTDVTASFTKNIISATDMAGNLGLGTLSPQARLDVKGTIRAKEVKIEMNAGEGADFVFEPDYNLKDLSELKVFIKENKHLPEIPSAKQMQEDGLNVNEMQIKLLQKIEELTLYIIKQQEQLDGLIEKNKELEKKIDVSLDK